MAEFKRILFPIDFSDESRQAAPYVVAFANHFGAEVLLLHTEALPLEPYVWEPQPELIQKFMAGFAKENLPNLDVQLFASVGDPAAEIVKYAAAKKADLIMMPTHGRGVFRRFILGSVTTKVLHDTACPVWTSAHLNEERPPAPPEIRNLVCAIDLDDVGQHTLAYAGGLARVFGASLTIAHAVPAVETWPESSFDTDLQADLMGAARTRIAEMQAAAGTAGTVCVGAGNVARFVAHAAKSHKAEMVVIGRGGHGMLGRLRTHDYAIIRECETPVLSI
jgi:nucleotide-binding universal stress UspA family protein